MQQRQGRVKPTKQMSGEQINDEVGLEREADVMGGKALQRTGEFRSRSAHSTLAVAQTKSKAQQGFGLMDNQPKANIQRKVIQRATWYYPRNDTYARYKGGIKFEGDYSDKNTNKLVALHEIAKMIQVAAGGPNNVGPHIAVSIYHKTMYVAINERFGGNLQATRSTPTMRNNLQVWSEKGVQNWLNQNKKKVPTNIYHWVDSVKNNIIIVQNKNTTNHKEAGNSGAWHGEIAIAEEIQSSFQEYSKAAPDVGLKKAIHIGGTQTNCFSCFVLLHGQLDVLNNTLTTQVKTGNYNTQNPGGRAITSSYQHQINTTAGRRLNYKLLTGGTHGGLFAGANHLGPDTDAFTDHTSASRLDGAQMTEAAKASRFHQSNDELQNQKYQIRLTKEGAQDLISRISDLQANIQKINSNRQRLVDKLEPEGLKNTQRQQLQNKIRGLNGQLSQLKQELHGEEARVKTQKQLTHNPKPAPEPVEHRSIMIVIPVAIFAGIIGTIFLINKLIARDEYDLNINE